MEINLMDIFLITRNESPTTIYYSREDGIYLSYKEKQKEVIAGFMVNYGEDKSYIDRILSSGNLALLGELIKGFAISILGVDSLDGAYQVIKSQVPLEEDSYSDEIASTYSKDIMGETKAIEPIASDFNHKEDLIGFDENPHLDTVKEDEPPLTVTEEVITEVDNSELEELRYSLSECQEELNLKLEEIDSLQSDLQVSKKEFILYQEEMTKQLSLKDSTIIAKESLVETLQSEVKELDSLRESNQTLSSNTEILRERLKSANERVEELMEERDGLEVKLKEVTQLSNSKDYHIAELTKSLQGYKPEAPFISTADFISVYEMVMKLSKDDPTKLAESLSLALEMMWKNGSNSEIKVLADALLNVLASR